MPSSPAWAGWGAPPPTTLPGAGAACSASSGSGSLTHTAPRTGPRGTSGLPTPRGPEYVPLLQAAYRYWRELEEVSGRSVLRVTGSLDIGPEEQPDHHGLPARLPRARTSLRGARRRRDQPPLSRLPPPGLPPRDPPAGRRLPPVRGSGRGACGRGPEARGEDRDRNARARVGGRQAMGPRAHGGRGIPGPEARDHCRCMGGPPSSPNSGPSAGPSGR